MKINPKLILGLVILLLSLNAYGQTIDKPTLNFSAACATDGFNNFTFSFMYRDGIFDAANVFRVFLSDEDGNFSPGTEILSVNNQNFTPLTPINGSFSVPNGTYGDNFRIRVVASNPGTTSPDSDAFGAYDITSEQLVLNNFMEDVVLCNGNPVTVTLNEIDPTFTYKWYRNDAQIIGETGISLTINQPGEYYAEINYGSCLGPESTKVNARIINSSSLSILGDDTVDLCADESYTLEASIDDNTFTYRWFKDDVEITTLPPYSPTYTTPTTDQFGVYRVEIEISGCSSRSQDVTLQQKSDATIDVDITGVPVDIIFPGETIELVVTHNATGSVDITWFEVDGGEIPGVSGDTLIVPGPGEYYAVVTETSGDCPVSGTSDTRLFLGVAAMDVTIRPGTDYEECMSENTELAMVGISVTATDGNDYDLSQEKTKNQNNL